jgi:hypothetical protein
MRNISQSDERILNGAGKHSRDPRLFGIRKRARRWEVRVRGGKSGSWIYVGLAPTIALAIQLRDNFCSGLMPKLAAAARLLDQARRTKARAA